MSERHELEMKAEEIFNMVFAPLGWDPDDMESALDECAQTAQEKIRRTTSC